MVPRSERRTRGWPLTQRLIVALSVGAFFVALILGFVGADRDTHRRDLDAAANERTLTHSLAERAAPLLERGDLMRLSVLAALVRDQANGRAQVLDRGGKVVIDTALVQGERQLGLLAANGPFQRTAPRGDGVQVRESLSPVRFGGEVIGEVRLQCEPVLVTAAFDASWFGLVLLSCLSLVAAAAMLGHHWSSRVRGATDAMIRLAAGELGGEHAAANESELQDLGSALRELERGMNDGLQRVGEGYVAMAMQVIDGLERRRLAAPGHGERTARLAARLAERLQLLPGDRGELDLACRLVDLGKAWVRASLLQKQGALSEVEAQSLQHHPVRAAEQLECVPALRRVARIVRHQLERYDGGGTPDGLRGDRIPLGSRVLAIVGAFDLMTTAGERPLSWDEALQRLAQARGDVFDPWLVDLFAEEIRRDPPVVASDREVMIVPGGAMPWHAEALGDDDLDDDDDDRDGGGGADDLEVVVDEREREDLL
jgi:HD-GYP domain-containing protein (c-di-GMP phosphodiesterase class II)